MLLTDLVPILQMAIGPVILISGVGLLLLSMTNRLGRAIDRARLLAEAFRKASAGERGHLAGQLEILSRRARLIRLAITLGTLSGLLACVLIIVLFGAALLRLEVGVLVMIIFVGCIGCLIGSLVAFLADINLLLSAFKLGISPHRPGSLNVSRLNTAICPRPSFIAIWKARFARPLLLISPANTGWSSRLLMSPDWTHTLRFMNSSAAWTRFWRLSVSRRTASLHRRAAGASAKKCLRMPRGKTSSCWRSVSLPIGRLAATNSIGTRPWKRFCAPNNGPRPVLAWRLA